MQTETQLANIGPNSAMKHGVKIADGVLMSCDRCCLRARCEECDAGGECGIERQYVADRRAQLTALEFIDPLIDGPALSVLIWQELRIMRASKYLSVFGELLPGADNGYLEAQPLNKHLLTVVNSWQRHLVSMGLTPPQRYLLQERAISDEGRQLIEAVRKQVSSLADGV